MICLAITLSSTSKTYLITSSTSSLVWTTDIKCESPMVSPGFSRLGGGLFCTRKEGGKLHRNSNIEAVKSQILQNEH